MRIDHDPFAKDAYGILEEYSDIDDEHLAKQSDSRVMIDMAALKKQMF